MSITYFVHGTTTDNEHDLATGWNHGKLSKRGRQESKNLGVLVAHQSFDVVFCSDLKRAVESATLAFENQYRIIQDARLRECNYGDKNGTPVSAFKNDLNRFVDEPLPHGESYRDVEKRMADFLAFLKKNYDGKHIAIVAHQAPQLALDVLLKKKTWTQAFAEDWRKTGSWQPGWDYILE